MELIQAVTFSALLGFMAALNVGLILIAAGCNRHIVGAVAQGVLFLCIIVGWIAYRSDPAGFRELFFTR